jgi:phosphomannomutase
VSDLTDVACYAYTKAFLQFFLQWEQHTEHRAIDEPVGRKVAVSGDWRSSTNRIIRSVYRAILDMGMTPMDCGRFATPTLALFAMTHQIPGIMVTGSHIPDDRNGIKLFLPDGEITKHDEQQIRSQKVDIPGDMFLETGQLCEILFPRPVETDQGRATQGYYARYYDAFPNKLLDGMRLGLYEHSAVGSGLLGHLYESLGAEVLRLGCTTAFVPVDTESLPSAVLQKTVLWSAIYQLDALLSTDGDGDRPLVFDENGRWLCGDIIAILTAWLLRAQTVVTPVTTSGVLERSGLFPHIIRTKVGSPYVMEAMRQAVNAGHDRVVGFEPNGGFLIGTPFSMQWLASALCLPTKNATIAPLPTRDSAIVHLAVLSLAKLHGVSLSQLAAMLPPCHKLSDRIPDYPSAISSQMLQQLAVKNGKTSPAIDQMFGELFNSARLPPLLSVDLLDGVRMTLEQGEIIHLRASGNAPEFRCYVEASSVERSRELLNSALAAMQAFRRQYH